MQHNVRSSRQRSWPQRLREISPEAEQFEGWYNIVKIQCINWSYIYLYTMQYIYIDIFTLFTHGFSDILIFWDPAAAQVALLRRLWPSWESNRWTRTVWRQTSCRWCQSILQLGSIGWIKWFLFHASKNASIGLMFHTAFARELLTLIPRLGSSQTQNHHPPKPKCHTCHRAISWTTGCSFSKNARLWWQEEDMACLNQLDSWPDHWISLGL